MAGMSDTLLHAGAMLVQSRSSLPGELRAGGAVGTRGWKLLADGMTASALAGQLRGSGWNLFFNAGGLEGRAFGAENPGTVETALLRLLSRAEADGCNCLEIESVSRSRSCGLPVVVVAAHARQICQGILAAKGGGGA